MQTADKLREAVPGGSPLLQQGELDFSPAENKSILKWALALVFVPGAKARDQSRPFPGALKRSFPRINAGAPTKKCCPIGTLICDNELASRRACKRCGRPWARSSIG